MDQDESGLEGNTTVRVFLLVSALFVVVAWPVISDYLGSSQTYAPHKHPAVDGEGGTGDAAPSSAEQPVLAGRSTATNGASFENTLPRGVTAHVVLHYRNGDGAARQRALAIAASLKAARLDVTDLSEEATKRGNGVVTYFYEDDQSLAKGLAERLALSAPLKGKVSGEQPPRPGTIAVAIE